MNFIVGDRGTRKTVWKMQSEISALKDEISRLEEEKKATLSTLARVIADLEETRSQYG